MKREKIIKNNIVFALIFVTCYLIFGCSNPFEPQQQTASIEAGYGRVSVNFAGGQGAAPVPRTVFPAMAFDNYVYTFTKDDGSGSASYEVTVAMWDSSGDGWDNSAALRINVNGINRATNASLASGTGPGYYKFDVNTGDVVQIYWVSGGQYDSECAFAVYYSDAPPSPAFDPSSGTTGGNVLVSKRYNNPSGAVGSGTLMGSFTATGSRSGESFPLSPDTNGLFTLEVGAWQVDVQAYVGEIDPDNLAATGTGNFTVSSGPTTEVTVALKGVVTDGYGTFTYSVQYPADADAEITLQKLPEMTASVDLTPGDTETIGSSIVITKTAENVPAGYYLLTVLISKGGLATGDCAYLSLTDRHIRGGI